MSGDELKHMLLARVDLKGLIVDDLLKKVLHDVLKDLVAKSDNAIDDAIVAIVEPLVVAEASRRLDELLAKLAA